MSNTDLACNPHAPDAGRLNNPIPNPDLHSGPPVGDPLLNPTRRAAISALTGGAFLAAGGAIPVGAAEHPDAQLLSLHSEFLRLDAEYLHAVDQENDCLQTYYEREPAKPSALAYRHTDQAELGFPKPTDPEDGFYQPSEIRALAAKPRRRKKLTYFRLPGMERVTAEVAAQLPPDQVIDADILTPCPLAQARADEIVRRWYDWVAQCERIAIETGTDAAGQAVKLARDRRQACAIEIASTKAHSIDGLRVRAKMIETIHEGDLSGKDDGGSTLDRKLMWATIRDLAAI